MGGYAWVTLATNDSYSLGALVLAHSLKQVGTQHQLAVLITPGVTEPMRSKLREVYNVVKEVNVLDSRDEANLRLLKRPELGVTFTKLHCWRLTQYDKCIFLDADTLVLENCDELFEREELSAAPDIGWPDCFNSGVFVYRPSEETYEKLIEFALDKGSFDGGDQGLLNQFFSDWAHSDISKHLPFIYNVASTACYSYLPAFKRFGTNAKIIHFIGSSKPWLQYFDTETETVHPTEEVRHLQDILQRWWNIFCSLIHPSLSTDMNIPSPTDTVHGSQSNNFQNVIHTSYYYNHENTPTPDIPNPAENYQHVWDPWEEYDSKQLNNQQCESNENITVQTSENYSQPNSHDNYQHSHSSINEFQNHHHHSNNIETHNSEVHIHRPEHQNQHHSNLNKQNELVESHNTNASVDASHDHCIETPIPTYSQPHTPTAAHYNRSHSLVQETRETEPPPIPPSESCPRLPDECVATTTVSNEISLHTDSNEDRYEDDAGIAGAFARLTLGVKRTPEQEALEDHLRRQGWEVGNIDYLGRDSFENIWSKICETITSDGSPAPPPQPSPPSPAIEQSKEPSPPKTAAEPATETAPVEPEKLVQPEQETPIIESSVTRQFESKPQDDIKEVSKPVSSISKSSESVESEPLKTTVEISTKATAYISGKSASLTSPAPTSPTLSPSPALPCPPPISESVSSKIILETKPVIPPSLLVLQPTPTAPETLSTAPITAAPATTPSPVPIASEPVSATPAPTLTKPTPVPTELPTPSPISPTNVPNIPAPTIESPAPIHKKQTFAPQKQTPSTQDAKYLDSASEKPSVVSQTQPSSVSKQSPKDVSLLEKSSEPEVSECPATSTIESSAPIHEKQISAPQKQTPSIPDAKSLASAFETTLAVSQAQPSSVSTQSPKDVSLSQKSSEPEVSESPPTPIIESPAPLHTKPTSAVQKQIPSTPNAKSLASAPETPLIASQAQPSSVSKHSPKDVSLLQKSSESEVSECPVPSKKSAGKKSKESVTIPRAEGTEAALPATPISPPPKLGKILGAQQPTPDTPPPTESSAGPTPPPRKSSGGTKKVSAKGKK